MKRIVFVATAAAMLIAAAAVFAATPVNTYKASYSFSSKKAGSAKKPAKLSFGQDIKVTPGSSADRAGVLLKIKTKIYGVKVDGKHFPTCTTAKINTAHTDATCPKGSRVASGSIKALLGPSTDPSSTSVSGTCNPVLHVYNAGQGKLSFFFVDGATGSPHACLSGSIKTGIVGAWKATYKQAGKNLAITIPIPHQVDYPLQGLVGSLQSEHLNWKSTSSKGHTSIASIACKGSKRPYSFSFTAKPIQGGAAQTVTTKGSGPCKK
ncbi:MAG TPA: hypothetical protein VFW09_07845 [Solirubrobacteraceae bacterium]|nr:hypothetical protein [Solirubrobacteraceae bacterium]